MPEQAKWLKFRGRRFLLRPTTGGWGMTIYRVNDPDIWWVLPHETIPGRFVVIGPEHEIIGYADREGNEIIETRIGENDYLIVVDLEATCDDDIRISRRKIRR